MKNKSQSQKSVFERKPKRNNTKLSVENINNN